jgi:tetratricopeptide (TPR) repeat protein/TolB-like protein
MSATLTTLFCAALTVASGQAKNTEAPPSVAVVPFAAIDFSPTWLGYALAETLSAGLLRHEREVPGEVLTRPVAVFSIRQVLGAAKAAGIDISKPLPPEQVRQLGRDLAARFVVSGSFRVKPGKKPVVLLKWRVWDMAARRGDPKPTRATTNVLTLATRADDLTGSILRSMGERPLHDLNRGRQTVPLRALQAYGKGLQILAEERLVPFAPVTLASSELKKAELFFEAARALAPTFWRAQTGLGIALALQGELDVAKKVLTHAAEHSDVFLTDVALGQYYVAARKEDLSEAAEVLAAATARYPGYLEGLEHLGNAYLRQGEPARAAEAFSRYRRAVPKNPNALLLHAQALAYLGEHGKAITATAALLREFPTSITVLTALAARQAQAEQYDATEKTIDSGLMRYPDWPALLTILSFVRLQNEHREDGLELANRAVAKQKEIGPELVAGYAQANLGHALALNGKKKEALAAFSVASRLGVGVDDRHRLQTDERLQSLMKNPNNALGKDTPPPAPAAPNAKTLPGLKAQVDAAVAEELGMPPPVVVAVKETPAPATAPAPPAKKTPPGKKGAAKTPAKAPPPAPPPEAAKPAAPPPPVAATPAPDDDNTVEPEPDDDQDRDDEWFEGGDWDEEDDWDEGR